MRSVIPGVHFRVDGQAAPVLESPIDIPQETKEERTKPEYSNPRDKQAREFGWLVITEGEFYNAQVTNNIQFFIEQITEDTWEAWRETYKNGSPKAIYSKVIAKGVPFQVALQRATWTAQNMRKPAGR